MTRGDFILNVNTWAELLEACYEIDSDVCSNIYDARDRDDYIYEDIHDNDEDWMTLRERLNEIPVGHCYYERCEDGYMLWSGVDDEFDTYKMYVLEDGDAREVWDNPLPISEDSNDDDIELTSEEFSALELLNSSNAEFNKLMSVITDAENGGCDSCKGIPFYDQIIRVQRES